MEITIKINSNNPIDAQAAKQSYKPLRFWTIRH